MLDPTLSYSCALFERPGISLEEASVAKLDAIYNQSTQNGGADNTIADGIVRLQKHAGIMDKDGRIIHRTPG